MSISDALNYPFRNNNLLKILPIALAYGIILYLVTYSSLQQNFVILCGAGLAFLVFTFVIAGYYVSALRRLQESDENLPDVNIGENAKTGVVVTLAGILYFLPLIIVGVIIVFMSGGMAASDSSAGGMGVLLMCGAMLIGIPVMLVLSAALTIGLTRYAAEGTTEALFGLPTNWSIATSNFGTVIGLWWRTFVIGLISAVISGVIQTILNAMFPQQAGPFYEPSIGFWLVFALSNVAIYTVTLIVGLAQYHLIYQFGKQLGIGQGKMKHDEQFSFDT